MRRHIDEELVRWRKGPDRKVLLVRGARQVGKTYAIRQLGATFEHFFEVNFEEETQIHTFFDGSLDPASINEKLTA
jgi:predicted AAA+ superfamily ATPase